MRPRAKAETAGAVTRLAAIALTSILTVCGPGVAQQSVTPKPATPQRAAAKSAPPAKPSAAESTKCIGVVSAIGDTFHLRKIGITVFNNDSNTVPIESWQIDNLVISKISTFLSKSWTVRRVNYPKGAFPRSMKSIRCSTTMTTTFRGSFEGYRHRRDATTMPSS
jgi:hypothetical protein